MIAFETNPRKINGSFEPIFSETVANNKRSFLPKNHVKKLLLLLPLIFLTTGMAYAEPFENLEISILDFADKTATLKITWDGDESVSHYKIGCVSCFPHITTSTTENIVVIGNVTSFPTNSIAMLYGIAYDFEDEIISAKQILVNLVQ